jgi:purine-nucleoside phosphorylase
MEKDMQKARIAALNDAVRALGPSTHPTVGLVLGSGLGGLADQIVSPRKVAYADIPHMPRSAVAGHAGNLWLGELAGVQVACLQGRVHAYEGHVIDDVVFGVALLAELGCSTVLLSNAAGGIAPNLVPGDLMLVTDHINLTGRNPLVGPNDDSVGPRFLDMTRAYSPDVQACARVAAQHTQIDLKEGVYAGLLGPTYETPAEIRMLATIGASAVGMSTVLETIALRHRGVRVGAMSCITNLAAGISGAPLSHAEVQETADRVRDTFVRLVTEWVRLVA